jgi:hypothetical protein
MIEASVVSDVPDTTKGVDRRVLRKLDTNPHWID